MFPTCKNSQKRVKNQKSTDKHLSFDGLIQECIDLSNIYSAVLITWNPRKSLNSPTDGMPKHVFKFYTYKEKNWFHQ